jgi:hypothetical protein
MASRSRWKSRVGNARPSDSKPYTKANTRMKDKASTRTSTPPCHHIHCHPTKPNLPSSGSPDLASHQPRPAAALPASPTPSLHTLAQHRTPAFPPCKPCAPATNSQAYLLCRHSARPLRQAHPGIEDWPCRGTSHMTAFLKAELFGPRVWAEAERAAGRLAQKSNGDVSPCMFGGGGKSTIVPI